LAEGVKSCADLVNRPMECKVLLHLGNQVSFFVDFEK